MKLACVVHRFGADIAGGSEAHCRHVAERLAATHDVTVLTTCAKDHITWRNEYSAGESRFASVRVMRFPVARQRSLHRFRDISEIAFSGTASVAEQEQWFLENGPDAPGLLDHLRTRGRDYDLVLFWAFRYAEVYFGLPHVADRAVLLPTAEDDLSVRMDVLSEFFARPAGYIFLTPEEQTLVERRVPRALPPSCIIGSGLDPAGPAPVVSLDSIGVRTPFLLYLGRVDPNKGCETLVQHFARYAAEHADAPPLVMAGPVNMPLPEHPKIKPLGFVDDKVREALLAHAAVLMVPSRFESLSLALLEGWNHAVPAIVNGFCSVLKGQVRRADGGLYYNNYDEFARALEFVSASPAVAATVGRQGLAYVEKNYRWPHVIAQINGLLDQVAHAR